MNECTTLNECTVQNRSGRFCNKPAWKDAPFPVCFDHALMLFTAMDKQVMRRLESSPERTAQRRADTKAAQEERSRDSVVYYARVSDDLIKIGTTTDLEARRNGLRIDPNRILATEPGSFSLEAIRHKQFANLRIGRREDFKMSSALIHHIEAVREFHGSPVFHKRIGPATIANRRDPVKPVGQPTF